MSDSPELSTSLRRNIAALRKHREQERLDSRADERLAEIITAFTGSMTFVYLHLALYGCWIATNLLPGFPHFDPTFVVLAMAASVEAIFLSTFVLISQNRSLAAANKRDDLDLHVNLLTEHELTKLIELVARIAAKLEVGIGENAEIEEISKDVQPEAVIRELDKGNRREQR